MTDKERLEIIKMDNERHHQEVVFSSQVLSDIKWLIQQAERVEELAKERAEWEIEARTQYTINKRLKKEIKQYRQALREIRNTDTTKEVYRLWAEQALKGEYRK